MTRQRFEGLRLELCRRLHENIGETFNGKSRRGLRTCRPKFEIVGSYDGAWETLKPARDCVGM